MRRKLLALVLCLSLLVSTCGIHFSVFAVGEAQPTITVETVAGERGSDDIIEVDINIANNPGIVGAFLTISYPADKLEAVSISDGGVLGGWVTPTSMVNNNPMQLTWEDGLASQDNKGNGTIVTLQFKVKNFEINDSTKLGLAPITVSYNYGEIYNFDMDPVDFTIVNGGINIICSHTYTNYASNNDAKCGVDGTKTAFCDKGCGATDTKSDVGTALTHKFTNYIYQDDETCTANGSEKAFCDHGCGATDVRSKDGTKIEHSFTSYQYNNDATCTADGTKTAYCDYGCGVTDVKTASGTKIDHKYTNYVSDGNAECEKDGTKTAKCDYNCGATDTKADNGSALEHTYTNYVYNNDAKCAVDGTETASCDHGCGETHTRAKTGTALTHKYTTYSSNNDATCTADGTKTASCDHGCGTKDTVADVGSKIPHKYTTYNSNNDATCTADGTKTASCDYGCGTKDTVADVGSKIPHKHTNYVSNNDAKCGVDGTKTAFCDYGCNTPNTVTDTGSALSHKYTNYEYNDDATYFANGTEKASCDHGCGTTDTREKAGTQLVDTILPTGEIKVKENSWKSFLNTITFGLFFNEKFDVTITGADNETGIKSIEYYKASAEVDDITTITSWTTGTSFSVVTEGQYIIYAKITDNSNNVLYLSSDGLVIDTTKPVIEGITNEKTYCAAQTFTVTDANLDYVKVNGTKTTNFTLTDDEYTIVAVDKSGNTTTVVVTVYEGHSFVTYTSNHDATCLADGTETAVCAHGCGQTDTRTAVGSKIPHKYTTYTSNGDATCTADGTKTAKCDYNCNTTDTLADVGSKIPHKYTSYKSNNDATCTADGTKTADCDYDCGAKDTVTDTGSRIPHKYTTYKSNNDAKCGVDGTKTASCDYDCGTKDTVADTGSALTHKYTTYTSNNDATCQADGTETATCDHGCGTKDTKTDAGSKADHKYTTYTSNNDAKCEEDGTETASCDFGCGTKDTRTATGSKLGHKWKLTKTDNATCTVDGTEYYTCENDEEHTKTETITAAGHKFGEWAETKAPTDKTVGEKRRDCENCDHFETAEIPMISYEFTQGADAEWKQDSNGDLTFKLNGEFAKFVGVEIDGQAVDAKYYTAVAGSTIVTFKADYLKTLSAGEHTLRVVYEDGSASTEFEIKAAEKTDDQTQSPQTGDTSNLILWVIIAFVSMSLLIVCIFAKRKERAR